MKIYHIPKKSIEKVYKMEVAVTYKEDFDEETINVDLTLLKLPVNGMPAKPKIILNFY